MPTTQDYINSLKQDLTNLKENLSKAGVEVTDTDNFSTLSFKAGGIPQEDLSEELNAQDTFIATQEVSIDDIKKALVSKGSASIKIQEKDVEITENVETVIEPDEEFDVLSKVTVTTNVPKPFVDVLNYHEYFTSRIPIFLKEIDYIEIPSNYTSLSYFFSGLINVEKIDFSKYDFSRASDLDHFAYCCKKIKEIDLSQNNMSSATTMGSAFDSCSLCETIKLSNISMAKLTNTSYMFSYCRQLKTIDFGALSSSPLMNTSYMFQYCEVLENLDLSSLNFSSLNSLNNMFAYCYILKNITFPTTKTSACVTFAYVFRDCQNLESIDLNCFNFNSVMNMTYAFYNCYKLKKLDLRNLSTTALKNMSNTFNGCRVLEELYLDNLNLTQLTTFGSMFSYCGNQLPAGQLTKVYVKDEASQEWVLTKSNGHPSTWSTDNVIIAGSEQDLREV